MKNNKEEIQNKSIKLKESTVKKIWTISDLTILKQGEVIDEAIKKYYPEALEIGQTITIVKDYIKKNNPKILDSRINKIINIYSLRKYRSNTEEEKKIIFEIIENHFLILKNT